MSKNSENKRYWRTIPIIILALAAVIFLLLTIFSIPIIPKVLISALTTSTAGLIAFLIQQSITLSIDTSLENYKKELQKELTEYQTKFTRLHQDRADVTAQLYKLLTKMQRSLTTTQNIIIQQLDTKNQIPKEVREKSIEQTWEDYNTLRDYFDEKSLYLPEDLCKKINTFLQICDQARMDQLLSPPPRHQDRVDHESFLRLDRAFDTVHVYIPKLRDEIKEEFRKMLGPL